MFTENLGSLHMSLSYPYQQHLYGRVNKCNFILSERVTYICQSRVVALVSTKR